MNLCTKEGSMPRTTQEGEAKMYDHKAEEWKLRKWQLKLRKWLWKLAKKGIKIRE